jgi:hypothetical protein
MSVYCFIQHSRGYRQSPCVQRLLEPGRELVISVCVPFSVLVLHSPFDIIDFSFGFLLKHTRQLYHCRYVELVMAIIHVHSNNYRSLPFIWRSSKTSCENFASNDCLIAPEAYRLFIQKTLAQLLFQLEHDIQSRCPI